MNIPVINFADFNKQLFAQTADLVFQYQKSSNHVFGSFINLQSLLSVKNQESCTYPFLPIKFFKTHMVLCGKALPSGYFESSATTGQTVSRHYVSDLSIYEASFSTGFKKNYGDPAQYCIVGLLPSYLEREHSSLVYMVNYLMKLSGHEKNGFFLRNHADLHACLNQLKKSKTKVILFGTTFALLDFADAYSFSLPDTIIIETGGMKGRREELLREQVHEKLKSSFLDAKIHSEYGMTELFSQAYANEGGRFICPPWMKVLVRDEDDPLLVKYTGKGALNIIDLANIHSCSFIATDDIGEVYEDGSFRILGRLDNSDIRGCSLLTV